MSTSFDERDGEKTTTLSEDEDKTETYFTSDRSDHQVKSATEKSELPFDGAQKACCRRVSDRDILIATLQSQLKSIENLYKKTLDEQRNIRKKYGEGVQKLSKEVGQKVELVKFTKPEVASQREYLDRLRTEIINRLEVSRFKPKKCCKYLYEALGVEIPAKKERKKIAKPVKVKKSPETTVKKGGNGKEEGSDLNKTEGHKRAELKNKKSLECKNTCGEIEAQAAEYERKEERGKHVFQKELVSQVAEMEEQEKELCDLQDKLKKLCQSMECLERSRTWASKLQIVTTPSKPPDEFLKDVETDCYEKGGDNTAVKPNEKKSSRSSSQEKHLKDSAKVPKLMSETVRPKEYAEQTKSVTLYHAVSYKIIDVLKGTKVKKAKLRSSPKQNPGRIRRGPEENIRGCATKSDCCANKNVKSLLEGTREEKNSYKQPVDEENFKSSPTQPDQKEEKKSRCCDLKRRKSHEDFPEDESADESEEEEEACCDTETCPFNTPQNKEFWSGRTQRFKDGTNPRCRCSSPKEKRSKSEDTEERAASCVLDECPLERWNSKGLDDLDVCGKYDASTSCHEKCPNVEKELKDAYEKALKTNKDLEMRIAAQKTAAARKDETIEDLENQLKDTVVKNKTLLCKFGCQIDELKTGYENAQKEVSRLKEHKEALNRKLLACLNDNAESTNDDVVEKLKAGYQLALREKAQVERVLRQKDDELNKLQRDLNRMKTVRNEEVSKVKSEQNTVITLTTAAPEIDDGALRKCESEFNELRNEYDQLKEKFAISEHERVFLQGKTDDLKDAFDQICQENEELKSCKLECDAIRDECRKECDESKNKAQEALAQLEGARREKNDLERQISELENLNNEGLATQEANAHRLSEELAKALSESENLRDQLTEAKDKSENELLEKHEELGRLRGDLERKSREFEAANDDKVNAEAQIGDLKCCLEEQKCRHQDALNELESARNAVVDLNEKLRAENARLNEDAATYETELEDVKKQLAETKEELQRADENLAESEEQLKCTVCKLHELIERYNLAQKELQENERELEEKLAGSLSQLEKVKLEASERTKEYEQERDENQKLRRELNQSTDDFHRKQKTLEEISLVLEQTRRDKANMESKVKELGEAQELTAIELTNLKEEANRVSQENQKTRLGDLDERAFLTKELEELRALKAETDENNENLVSSYNSKMEKLSADYREAQDVIQRLNKTLNDTREKESEDKIPKCSVECRRRCAERKRIFSETKLPKIKREECKKTCVASSRDKIKRTVLEEPEEEEALVKTDEPINKECRDLCAELNSMKKMLSNIEIVCPKPNAPLKGRSLDSVDKQKGIARKSDSWKEEYEKTVLERDALKQEISETYNKLKEVMKELENKLNV